MWLQRKKFVQKTLKIRQQLGLSVSTKNLMQKESTTAQVEKSLQGWQWHWYVKIMALSKMETRRTQTWNVLSGNKQVLWRPFVIMCPDEFLCLERSASWAYNKLKIKQKLPILLYCLLSRWPFSSFISVFGAVSQIQTLILALCLVNCWQCVLKGLTHRMQLA